MTKENQRRYAIEISERGQVTIELYDTTEPNTDGLYCTRKAYFQSVVQAENFCIDREADYEVVDHGIESSTARACIRVGEERLDQLMAVESKLKSIDADSKDMRMMLRELAILRNMKDSGQEAMMLGQYLGRKKAIWASVFKFLGMESVKKSEEHAASDG